LAFVYLFCFFVIGELTRTAPWRVLVSLDGREFGNFGGGDCSKDVFVGLFSRETWMGVEEWTDAGVKACHFNMSFNT
jgi:hypothetical protein